MVTQKTFENHFLHVIVSFLKAIVCAGYPNPLNVMTSCPLPTLSILYSKLKRKIGMRFQKRLPVSLEMKKTLFSHIRTRSLLARRDNFALHWKSFSSSSLLISKLSTSTSAFALKCSGSSSLLHSALRFSTLSGPIRPRS